METIILQNIQVHIFDIDTKQIIQKDFLVLLYPVDSSLDIAAYPESQILRNIRAGSDTLTNVPIIWDFVHFSFIAEQVQAYGYELPTDTTFYFEKQDYPYYGDVSTAPWVMNIFMKKLAE